MTKRFEEEGHISVRSSGVAAHRRHHPSMATVCCEYQTPNTALNLRSSSSSTKISHHRAMVGRAQGLHNESFAMEIKCLLCLKIVGLILSLELACLGQEMKRKRRRRQRRKGRERKGNYFRVLSLRASVCCLLWGSERETKEGRDARLMPGYQPGLQVPSHLDTSFWNMLYHLQETPLPVFLTSLFLQAIDSSY